MPKPSSAKIEQLRRTAAHLRRTALTMIHRAGGGHPGGSLSAADIIAALYFHEMNIRPHQPDWPQRDRFIMSKGHACPILYAALAQRGYFDPQHLDTLRRKGSILQGHPDMRKTPGIDATTGSLGQGLSVGLGMALMARLDRFAYRVFVLLGCGELDEGQVWEAAMCAHKYRTANLTAIIDYNRLQLDGTNDQIMPLEPLRDKWLAFGWHVLDVDGHDIGRFLSAVADADSVRDRSSVIIARTIKGKGVSFMENQLHWHGQAPTDQQLATALQELTVQ